jgi:radical SAM superfamily enzyme YgiQ (UPF0313 family)
MDSMLNHYTASRSVRNDDAYSPGGRDRPAAGPATKSTASAAAKPTRACPVIAGGVEASLRRHRPLRLLVGQGHALDPDLDSKADLIAYGMGEA